MQKQRLLYTTVISIIFILTAAFLLLSTRYRVDAIISENQDTVSRYIQQFFDQYRQRTENYNQNQTIRNMLRYAVDTADEISYKIDPGFNLPSDVSLYTNGRQIYPSKSEPALSEEILEHVTEETLIYTDALYYLVPYYNFTQTKQLGLLCYEIFSRSLTDFCLSNIPSQLVFTLYDSKGNAFYQSENISLQLSSHHFTSQNYLFSGLVYVDSDSYYQPAVVSLVILFLVCLVGIFISSYFFRRLAQRIVFPINQLSLAIRHSQSGELTYTPAPPSNLIEIDQISYAYKEMLDHIRLLMEQNHKQNLLKAESELKVLQEKINPHFLFNTLELISSQAILEDADKTAQMAQKLGSLFRYSLRMPDILYLKQELQYIRDYLFLQNVRFNDRIFYEIYSTPDLEQFLLPKLTLQPILENCFKHGFANETNKNHHIEIQVSREGDFVVIHVHDDGHGIETAQSARLNQDMELDLHDFAHFVQRGEHIGLRNVNARLCSYYKIPTALTLSPSPLGGTNVTIQLPFLPNSESQGGKFYHV